MRMTTGRKDSSPGTKERLLDAAELLFAREGYHSTSLRALTAGDSPPAASSEQEREAGDSPAPTPPPASSSGLSAPLVAWLLVAGLAIVIVVLVLILVLA